jgi:7-keto-8-aminopelargonate synthetase-like enzyme
MRLLQTGPRRLRSAAGENDGQWTTKLFSPAICGACTTKDAIASFAELERVAGAFPRARFHQMARCADVTVWCSNDYLAMGQHPVVIEAMQAAIGAQARAPAARATSPAPTPACWRWSASSQACTTKTRRSVFTSGYVANETTLQTLGAMLPGLRALFDAFNHASMIAGHPPLGRGAQDLPPQRPSPISRSS